jgi:hypothetical protein
MKEPNPTIGLRDTKKFPRDNASARSVGELRDLGRNVTGASGSNARLLALVGGWSPEGFEMRDLREAKTLLGALT